LLDEADAVLRPPRVTALLSLVQMQRGLLSLTAGRYDEAYERLARIFDPADLAHHYREQYCAIGLFADAAALTGHREEARRILRVLGEAASATTADGLTAGVEYATPVLADEGEAEPLFIAALESIDRPFDRARLNLAFGMWLRRRRRVTESRELLRRARDDFDALRVPPWAERARRELRAAGEASRRRRPEAWHQLSPQELQIARLAAGGLSNREIAAQLYVSHRTVANHLYRMFPKLGISSRSQLHHALPA
jgi:DNA-binding CsgD family transcriptional regulator